MGGEADEIVSTLLSKWSAGFERLDAPALASLYARGAFFFGSNPRLYRGRDGVAAYFNGLPRWRSPSVRFSEVTAAQVAPELINMAAIFSFDFAGEREPLSVKMSWVIMREDGDWKIVSHHASSRGPLI
jgi:ketosteroid isomerase-like protein